MRALIALRTFAFVHVIVLSSWGVSEACTCAPEAGAVEALAAVDAGFVGTVVDQRSILLIDGVNTGPGIEYDVFVHRAWKGIGGQRIALRRLSRCAPGLGVGETSLIYARRMNGTFVLPACLLPKRIDGAATDLVQLGGPAVTFAGSPQPVATSLPLSRWIRAHVVAGVGLYVFTYLQWEWAAPTWHMIAFLSLAILLVLAAAVSLFRRRWRVGARFLAAGILVSIAGILWAGHVFLRRDWSEPVLRW